MAAAKSLPATGTRKRRADSGALPKLAGAALRLLAVLGVLGAAVISHADVRFLDQVVAEIDGTPVAASDVAIARALGLFELNPAPRAIEATDVERYVDGRLLTREAARLGLATTADERTRGVGGHRRPGGWSGHPRRVAPDRRRRSSLGAAAGR